MLKSVLSAAVLAFASANVSEFPLELTRGSGYTFDQFQVDFKKEYPRSELPMREALFQKNVREIIQHNSNNSTTWKKGVNKFVDMSDEERLMFRGHSRTGGQLQEIALPKDFMDNLKPISDLPESVDWRTKGITTPVKDQGGCGSCWAFSTTEVIESSVAIATGKLLKLSPQQLVSCVENPNQCGGTGGCDGATQWLGFNYTMGAGISTEADYPYTQRTGTCNAAKIKPAAGIKGYVRLPANNYTALMNAIQVGPVAISVAADMWSFYSSGILSGICGTTIDHAVVLEGYGPGYYLVRNSWGDYWGEKGYIRVKRTDQDDQPDNCGVDHNPSDGTACKPYPDKMTVCGLCGILSDSSYPTGAFVSSSILESMGETA